MPIYTGMKKMIYFNELIAKVSNRITNFHTKSLSFGGKPVLIKVILASLSLHIISVTQPPKTCIHQMEKSIANFF